MNVKLIRLNTGEDVIADLISETENSLVLSNPIVAVPSGRGELGFAPWSPLLSKEVKEITINKHYVVYVSETQDQIVEQYNQIFSPIITPSKQLSL
jgi:hypothetical protein